MVRKQAEAKAPSVTDAEIMDLLSRGRAGKLRLSQILPWTDNPRDHDPEQIRLLVKSIRANGFIAPFLLQEGTNKCVAGHGRRLALQQMIPAGSDPEVPVVWAALDENQAKAYAIADNRLTDLSTWNIPLLKASLTDLDNGAFDLESTGFTAPDLADLFGLPAPASSILSGKDPEEAPPLPAPGAAVTRRGDLILLGNHRLLCGDSTNPEDWARLMDGRKADLVVTDPPYRVSYASTAAGLKAEGKQSIQNDDLKPEELEVFLKSVFLCAANYTEKHAAFYVFYASRYHREFENALNHASLETRAQIIWVKNAATFGFAQYKWKHEPVLLASAADGPAPLIYVPAHETAFYAFKQKQAPYWEGDRAQTTVWSVSRETGYRHPSQKPVELLKRPILNSSKPRMLVCDPFGGSGSTLMACEVLGRYCCTMEIEPGFADVIVQRWEEATGRKSTRIRPEPAVS